MSKRITIYDIAREFGVSASTVSRSLKDHTSIGEKTREAIKKYAAEQGYKVNSVAANLRNRKTNTLGIIVSWINRPFISSMISGVETVANNNGLNVLISQTRDHYEREVANANTFFQNHVDGLIVSLAMESVEYHHFDQFINNNIPLVFVDRVPEITKVDKIIIDNYQSAYSATTHLIDLGCKRIAHIGGSQSRYIYRERKNGYIEALKEHGLKVDEDMIRFNNTLDPMEAVASANQLLDMKEAPDGFFCANDSSAVSVIQCSKSKLINIPEDLKVVGFNDDPVATIIDPQLSTIGHPAKEMGEIAAEHVLSRDRSKPPETVILETKLIIRGSTVSVQDRITI